MHNPAGVSTGIPDVNQAQPSAGTYEGTVPGELAAAAHIPLAPNPPYGSLAPGQTVLEGVVFMQVPATDRTLQVVLTNNPGAKLPGEPFNPGDTGVWVVP